MESRRSFRVLRVFRGYNPATGHQPVLVDTNLKKRRIVGKAGGEYSH